MEKIELNSQLIYEASIIGKIVKETEMMGMPKNAEDIGWRISQSAQMLSKEDFLKLAEIIWDNAN